MGACFSLAVFFKQKLEESITPTSDNAIHMIDVHVQEYPLLYQISPDKPPPDKPPPDKPPPDKPSPDKPPSNKAFFE